MLFAKGYGFEANVLDRENTPVALIQVKAEPLGKEWTPLLRHELNQFAFPPVDFVLTIDPVSIHLYRLKEGELTSPIVRLDTQRSLATTIRNSLRSEFSSPICSR